MEQDNKINEVITPAGQTEEKTSLGPVVAIIIIVVLIALGGVYVWKNLDRSSVNSVPQAQTGATLSDEAVNIQAELNSINTGTDAEINNLESQL